MKHLGVCSVLIACCLTAPAWAVRFGEKAAPAPAAGTTPVSLPDAQVQALPEETYMPWQVYGNGSPYDQSAIAGYIAWPQVCTDGLWDNFCNEQHCFCYKGPKHHGGHCGFGNQTGGCNSCGTAACGCGKRHHGKHFTPVCNTRGNCANGNCATAVNGNSFETQPTDAPALEMQPIAEPALQPQAVPEPPSEEQSSARLPRFNPARQPSLMPANWRGVK